jgi:hypothetical protein
MHSIIWIDTVTGTHRTSHFLFILFIVVSSILHRLYTKKPWSKKHGATPLLDHFLQSKNQARELHQQKEPHTAISVDDEFEELGPSVSSAPKSSYKSWREVPQKEVILE